MAVLKTSHSEKGVLGKQHATINLPGCQKRLAGDVDGRPPENGRGRSSGEPKTVQKRSYEKAMLGM